MEYERFGRIAVKRGQPHNFDALASIRAALEINGIEFIKGNGEEPGVRLTRSND